MRRPLRSMWFSLAIATLSTGAAHAQTWIGTASGNWSTAANWTPGLPTSGTGTSLTFSAVGSTSYTATNDLGNPFQLNALTFATNSSSAITVTSATGNQIELAGANPTINITGRGDSTLAVATGSSINLNPSSGTTTIGGSGPGNLTISGIISGVGQGLRINGGAPSVNTQVITLSGANTFSGGLTLDAGNLAIGNAAGFGTGAVTINGGSLRGSTTVTATNNVTLNSTLLFESAGGTLTLGGILSGNGGIRLEGQTTVGGLTLTGVNTFVGGITFDMPAMMGQTTNGPANPGTLTVNGAGTIVTAGTANVRSGGIFTVADSNNSGVNRVNNNSALFLNGGIFNYTGGTVANNEAIGGLVLDGGHNAVNVTSGTGQTQVTFASLTRSNRATTVFTGTGLGNLPGAGVATVNFNVGPSLVGGGGTAGNTNISILPFAVGVNTAAGTANSFVTYDGNGVRPLNTTTEYAANFTGIAGTTTQTNVRLTAVADLATASGTTINSLITTTGTLSNSGGGALTVTSGAILTAGGSISTNLAFGANEAIITSTSAGTLSGVISGSGGLTKAGVGALTLSAANTYTGTTTINAGVVNITSAGNLGGSTAIVAGGPNATTGPLNRAGITNTAAAPVTLAQDINILSGLFAPSASNSAGTLTLAGQITGAGGLYISTTGNVILTNNSNNYTGQTRVFLGSLQFSNDTQLGNGGGLDIGSGTATGVVLTGDWTTSRHINISFTSQVDTGAFNTTWNGLLTGTSSLNKAGSGSLTLNTSSVYTGTLTAIAGTFRFANQGAIRSLTMAANTGGILELDNSGTINNDRVNDNATVTLNNGQFRLLGGAGNVRERAGNTLSLAASSSNMITVTAAGSNNTVLVFGALTNGAGNTTVFRGDNLGGNSGAFTRIQFVTAPTLTNGLIAGALFDPSSTGLGASLATYDATVDANGAFGVRAVTPDQTNGNIQNPANGGATPTTANFLVSSATVNNVTPLQGNTINSLTMGGTNPIVNVGGDANPTLTLTSGITLVQSGTTGAVINGGTLAYGTVNANFITLSNLTVSSDLTGTGGLTKAGPGTLTLGGNYGITGALSVGAGSLTISSAVTATTTTLNAGTSLTVGGAFSGTTTTLGLGATFNAGGNYTTTGTTTVNSGGTLNASGNVTTATLAGTGGTVNLGSGSLLTVTGSTQTINSTITGAAAAGATFTPSAASTFTLNGNNSFGGGLTGNANTTFTFGNLNAAGTGPLTLNNAVGTTTFNTGSGTFANNIVLPAPASASTLVFTNGAATNQTVTLGGVISGGNPNLTYRFTGAGDDSSTFVLSNPNNTFRGTVSIFEGVLAITSNGALGDAANSITLNTTTATLGGLRFDGDFTGGNALNRNLNFLDTNVLNTNGNNAVVSGVVSGSGAMNKAGAGTLTLSNSANTHTGAVTVAAGRLDVDGNVAASANAVTVSAAGTLGGTGTVNRPVTVNGTLTAGAEDDTGIFSVNNNVTFNAGSTFFVEMQGATAGTGYDQLTLTAASSTYTLATTGSGVTLSGERLDGFVANFLDAFVILNNTNTTPNSGTGIFAGLPDGAVFTLDNQVFQIRYNVGTFSVDGTNGLTTLTPGGSIVIAAVPEPSTIALFGLSGTGLVGAVGFTLRRRRKLKRRKHAGRSRQSHEKRS